MTRAENKALQARIAVRVLATMTAKQAIKDLIRARGERVSDFTAKEIALRAEEWVKAHPEMIAEAREKAARSGYC